MIPKKIHYCWFGNGTYPDMLKYCIASWKKFCPDYEIIEWNESNFDINCCDYVREAYEAKKWAFVSDYARLKIIYEEGGVYLDTDVELIKPLDELLIDKCFLATETSRYIATGLGFGAEKNSIIIQELLDEYKDIHFLQGKNKYDMMPCPRRNTAPLLKKGFTFSESQIWRTNEVTVYPPSYFCPINYVTKEKTILSHTFSIHHYSALWIPDKLKRIEKEISEIEKNHNRITALIKRQKLRYSYYKEAGEVDSYFEFLVNKINSKMKNK